LKKHRYVLHELEMNDLIRKSQLQSGKRIVIMYKPTQKGIEFCRRVIDPYQRMFPRKKESSVIINNGNQEHEYEYDENQYKEEEKIIICRS
jgi:DNA-binding PadR family transcriptional regulator